MKRYIKYSKKYRLAIALFIAATATTATAAAIIATINQAPNMLNNVAFTSTLFFVPTIAGAALMMGLKYWYSAESRRNTFFVDN